MKNNTKLLIESIFSEAWDCLFENTSDTDGNIFIHVHDSEPLIYAKTKLEASKHVIPSVSGNYWTSQMTDHNNVVKKLKPNYSDLHGGSVFTTLNSNNVVRLKQLQDELEESSGKKITLSDLKNIFETDHIYERHSVKNHSNGNEHIVTSTRDLPLHLETLQQTPHKTERGVLFTRLTKIEPGITGISVNADIYHQGIKDNGSFEEYPDLIGYLGRKIHTDIPSVEHTYFEITNSDHKNKRLANTLLHNVIPKYSKKLGTTDISLYATGDGAAVWSKMGAALDTTPLNGEKPEDSYLRFQKYKNHLKDFYIKKGFDQRQASDSTGRIINELQQKNKELMQKAGKSDKEINQFVQSRGLEPYLMANTKIHVNDTNHSVGFDFLKDHGFGLVFPISHKSKYNHMYPIVSHRFKGLEENE